MIFFEAGLSRSECKQARTKETDAESKSWWKMGGRTKIRTYAASAADD